MTFNKPFSQGRAAILDYAYGGSTQLSRAVYAVIVADTWDPSDYTGTANMLTAEVSANLWSGETANGGNATDDPVTVTVSSTTASDGKVTSIIADVEFGQCTNTGGDTVYSDPGWIVFFVKKATDVTDADRYIIGVADFAFTPINLDDVTWLADDTGTFIDTF